MPVFRLDCVTQDDIIIADPDSFELNFYDVYQRAIGMKFKNNKEGRMLMTSLLRNYLDPNRRIAIFKPWFKRQIWVFILSDKLNDALGEIPSRLSPKYTTGFCLPDKFYIDIFCTKDELVLHRLKMKNELFKNGIDQIDSKTIFNKMAVFFSRLNNIFKL